MDIPIFGPSGVDYLPLNLSTKSFGPKNPLAHFVSSFLSLLILRRAYKQNPVYQSP